ncbi:Origin recognition complex subunit 2 [Lunasporangiospora selenospora]|uniref:Origin recognition complex subunit 2 n=1 Tax=Lunasporangiospora selenospora TaxID=979761 RepID=A0A9P6G138_9FUNG|nr:Origin recognition complex subunit 2 [Lunasporangiospora selenospora]
MIHILYQANDDIATHITCQVSQADAEREAVIAKRLRKKTPVNASGKPRHKRSLGIQSGLTVGKASSTSTVTQPSAAPTRTAATKGSTGRHGNKGGVDNSADIQRVNTELQDVFLPSIPTSVKAEESKLQEIDGIEDSLINRHVRGREVFGFQTPKKAQGLKSIIESGQQPQERAEKGSKKQDSIVNDNDRDSAAAHSKRRRITRTIAKMTEASSEEEGEEDDHDAEEDEESEVDQEPGNFGDGDDEFSTGVARDASQAAKISFFEEDEMGAERYFQDLHQKSRTSNNTLSKLPTLEHADFIRALKGAPVKHTKEIEMLSLLYEEQFPQWYFELISGFNLLFYGYGSKRQLLTHFATTVLTDAPLIIVNGYFPTLGIKEILDRISSGAMKYSGPTGTLQEQVALIHGYFAQPDRDIQKIYLLIHNIDGGALRSEKTQSALSVLASSPHIHLIASIDHINANLLWDTVKAARFQWVWHELTTYKTYLTETSFENSIMVRQGELGPRGIQFVLASLTSNGRGLFKILAEHQIQTDRDAGIEMGSSGGKSGKVALDAGMPYQALFKRCQEAFLVSNAVTFRTQLTEFRDHRIVQSRKAPDGTEILYIPLAAGVLEGILEKMSS